MKRSLTVLAATVILASVPALANSSTFGVMVNLGLPLPVVPIVAMVSTPGRVPPPAPGISLEMGVPYDLVSYGNRYYARQDGEWFYSGHSNGPWQPTTWRYLPEQIRHRYETVRERHPVMYGEHENRYQRDEQYRQMVRYDSREGHEGYRIERGRDNDRHDHDDRH